MKRQLTKTERELEQKGLDRNKKELTMLESQLKYNEELLAQQNAKAEFDDKWRPFLRQSTAYENEQALKLIRENVAMKKESVRIAEDLLKNGVTVKHNQTG